MANRLVGMITKLIDKIRNYLNKSMPEAHFVTFEGHVRGEPAPKVSCTCGWEFGPHRLQIMRFEADEHHRATGHIIIDSEYRC